MAKTPTYWTNHSIEYAIGDCYLGRVLTAAFKLRHGLCFVGCANNDETLYLELRRHFPRDVLQPGAAMLSEVIRHIQCSQDKWDWPMMTFGTAFQREVWHEICKIPMGETATYADLALRLQNPRSQRAVAQACGANPIAIIIPCHRVIATVGIGGYRWGIERKIKLLEREGAWGE